VPELAPGELHSRDFEQSGLHGRIEVRILSADGSAVRHRRCSYPSVHDLHCSPDCLKGDSKAGQLVPHGLVDDQRLRDLSSHLQGTEAPRHLLMAGSSKDAVAKLGQSHDADGDFAGEIAKRPLLLTRDEDGGVENRLHANVERLQLVGRVWK
jgi:hypothetical protein